MTAQGKIKQHWRDMSDEDRLLAISERADRTFEKIGIEFGVHAQTLSKFIRGQGTTYHKLKAEHKEREWSSIADQAAPLWAKGVLTFEIAAILNISSTKLDRVIAFFRQKGDERFPRRATTAPPKPRPEKQLVRLGLSLSYREAFLREHHPNGQQYTHDCIGKAHREFPKGFKFRKASPVLSQRELTNLIQSARVRA